jgi:hypothetical protein
MDSLFFAEEAFQTSRLVCKRQPFIHPDPYILKQLLVPNFEGEGMQGQLQIKDSGSYVGSDSSPGEIPAVVINNALLRKHFKQLTKSFLKPFKRYFGINTSAVSSAAHASSKGERPRLYTNPENLMQRFVTEDFLRTLERDKVKELTPLLRSGSWKPLYRAFIDSRNFKHWFQAQRNKYLEQNEAAYRAVRMETTVSTLMRMYHFHTPGGEVDASVTSDAVRSLCFEIQFAHDKEAKRHGRLSRGSSQESKDEAAASLRCTNRMKEHLSAILALEDQAGNKIFVSDQIKLKKTPAPRGVASIIGQRLTKHSSSSSNSNSNSTSSGNATSSSASSKKKRGSQRTKKSGRGPSSFAEVVL